MRNSTSLDAPPPGITDPLTPGDVARLFNVDPKTVLRWSSLISFRTPGGHRRYHWADVSQILRQRQSSGSPQHAPRPPRRRPGQLLGSAVVRIGSGHPLSLDLTPVPAEVTEPGTITLVLGWTSGGNPVTLTTTRLQWLDDLEYAIQAARAAAVVEADMKVPL